MWVSLSINSYIMLMVCSRINPWFIKELRILGLLTIVVMQLWSCVLLVAHAIKRTTPNRTTPINSMFAHTNYQCTTPKLKPTKNNRLFADERVK